MAHEVQVTHSAAVVELAAKSSLFKTKYKFCIEINQVSNREKMKAMLFMFHNFVVS